ncbi:S8 family peptidase [Malaciobacter sp. WC5094]
MKIILSISFIVLLFQGCGGGGGSEKSTSALINNNSTNNEVLFEDKYLSQQWYLKRNTLFYSFNSIANNAHINPSIYLKNYSGKGVRIAIIDDGFDVNHEDLKGAVNNTYDLSSKSTNVSQNSNESHGTAVSGIIGARDNKLGIKGIASNSQLIFLKHKRQMSDSETIELFNKAEEFKADIINCSWGTYNVSAAVRNKIVNLANNGRNGKGTIIVFSSGNESKNMGNDESNIPEVISVAATNKDNLLTSYSNYGVNLDLVAPGGEYLGITTLDDSGLKGKSSIDENYMLFNDSNRFTGTSAAAPIVTGVIALMLEKNPNLTRIEVENLLKNSSDKIGTYSYENGRNNYYGSGKINLTSLMQSF